MTLCFDVVKACHKGQFVTGCCTSAPSISLYPAYFKLSYGLHQFMIISIGGIDTYTYTVIYKKKDMCSYSHVYRVKEWAMCLFELFLTFQLSSMNLELSLLQMLIICLSQLNPHCTTTESIYNHQANLLYSVTWNLEM